MENKLYTLFVVGKNIHSFYGVGPVRTIRGNYIKSEYEIMLRAAAGRRGLLDKNGHISEIAMLPDRSAAVALAWSAADIYPAGDRLVVMSACFTDLALDPVLIPYEPDLELDEQRFFKLVETELSDLKRSVLLESEIISFIGAFAKLVECV